MVIFTGNDIIGFSKQQQPVACFVGFFQGDLKFCDEIRFAVSILRFVDICSDTGSGSANLIGDDRFVLAFQEFYQIEDFNSKRYRQINKFV